LGDGFDYAFDEALSVGYALSRCYSWMIMSWTTLVSSLTMLATSSLLMLMMLMMLRRRVGSGSRRGSRYTIRRRCRIGQYFSCTTRFLVDRRTPFLWIRSR